MARAKREEDGRVEHSRGNVFADLGLPNPEEHLVKATIALAIAQAIRKRGLTQEQAGAILGLAQPKVSDMIRGELEKFTIDRLMRYMRKLDYDVTILIRDDQKQKAEAKLEAFLLTGLDSSDAQDMTQADWDEIRHAVRKKAAERKPA